MNKGFNGNSFVQEKIKNKPINKKRAASRLLFSALNGLLFAVVFAVVTYFSWPIITRNGNESEGTEKASSESTDMSDMGYADEETNADSSDEIKKDSNLDGSLVSGLEGSESEGGSLGLYSPLSLRNYQELQYELYGIGEKCKSAIVGISSIKPQSNVFGNSTGNSDLASGVIIKIEDSQYLILTEMSSMSNTKNIYVTFADGEVAKASLRQKDSNSGIAIVAVPCADVGTSTRNKITVASIGNSDSIQVGEIVLALGNPYGTFNSILTGVITSTDNEVTVSDHNFSVLTTDITANKKSSGILVNTDGNIIGMVLKDYNAASGGESLTAIATTDLVSVIQMLEEQSAVPYVGLKVATVTETISQNYNIPQGVYISDVAVDSPAMAAGLQSGDVIISINESKVTTARGYTARVLKLVPNKVSTFEVKRLGANGYSRITCEVEVQSLD